MCSCRSVSASAVPPGAEVVEDERALVDLRQESGRHEALDETPGDRPARRAIGNDPARVAKRRAERALVAIGERVDRRGRCAPATPRVCRSALSASASMSSPRRNCSLSSGMIVSATTSDTSTAIVSVIDSAWKNCPSTPVSSPSGRKTTTVVIVDVVTGQISSCTASRIAIARSWLQVRVPDDVLGDHDRVVDHEADRDRHRAERHQVERLSDQRHDEHGDRHRDRNRRRADRGDARVAQEEQQDDRRRARRR